jgi:type I restriction enzyme R subunit
MKPAFDASRTNFAFLGVYDEQLVRLGMLGERYFPEDPNTTLLKMRQLAELLAQLVATRIGVFTSRDEGQYELVRRLQVQGILPHEVAQLFGEVRRAGNAANHANVGDHRTALAVLKIAWQLGLWFHRTFANPGFKSGPFVPPAPPKEESDELRAELTVLSKALAEHQAAHHETTAQLASTATKLKEAKDEQAFWEQMTAEAEQAMVALAQKLSAEQAQGLAQPKESVAALVAAATTASS